MDNFGAGDQLAKKGVELGGTAQREEGMDMQEAASSGKPLAGVVIFVSQKLAGKQGVYGEGDGGVVKETLRDGTSLSGRASERGISDICYYVLLLTSLSSLFTSCHLQLSCTPLLLHWEASIAGPTTAAARTTSTSAGRVNSVRTRSLSRPRPVAAALCHLIGSEL